MFHQKTDQVTVVIYDTEKKAVALSFRRGLIKRTVLSLVFILVLLLSTIGVLVLKRKQKAFYEFDKYQREQLYLKEREDLLAKIQLLTDENNTLLMKLNAAGFETAGVATPIPTTVASATPLATPSPTATSVTNVVLTPKATQTAAVAATTNVLATDIFNYVKRPIGFKNLTEQILIKIDNVQLSQNAHGITVNFDLINNANETKITGYALVVARNQTSVRFYPAHPAYINSSKVPYNIGEQFGFSRMRPVVATFKNKTPGLSYFSILIFTRAGDLLLKKEIGPYEIK